MGDMSLAWVNAQIEIEKQRGNHPDAVRDLASLLTVRDHLAGCKVDWETMMDKAEAALHKMAEPGMRDQNSIHIGTYADNRGRAVASDHLTKAEAESWVRSMRDGEGHRGGRWTLAEIKQYAGNFGVTGDEEIIDFYAAMNAMATDYGEVAKAHGVDNVDFYADMAKAFLHDRDAVQGKIKRYYEDIAEV